MTALERAERRWRVQDQLWAERPWTAMRQAFRPPRKRQGSGSRGINAVASVCPRTPDPEPRTPGRAEPRRERLDRLEAKALSILLWGLDAGDPKVLRLYLDTFRRMPDGSVRPRPLPSIQPLSIRPIRPLTVKKLQAQDRRRAAEARRRLLAESLSAKHSPELTGGERLALLVPTLPRWRRPPTCKRRVPTTEDAEDTEGNNSGFSRNSNGRARRRPTTALNRQDAKSCFGSGPRRRALVHRRISAANKDQARLPSSVSSGSSVAKPAAAPARHLRPCARGLELPSDPKGVVMRWSRTFIPTLKEDPADAEMASHKLMLRAGLIRKLSAGVYSYLPLGARSLRKAAELVRREMDRAGAVELFLPALHPRELWHQTGRDLSMGDVLLAFKDRHGRENVLGPTHEEVITDIVRGAIRSYKQLPVNLYQIQTKFRDEPRPRSGVLRSREFLMKDAYSFDADEASLDRSYQAMYRAYGRIFALAGIAATPAEADSGAIGGAVNHEFMALCPAGEDTVARCPACAYAANTERCACPPPPPEPAEPPAPMRAVPTPGASTIEQVSALLGVPPRKLVKTLIYTVKDPAGKQQVVAVLVRGDHQVNETKLAKLWPGQAVELADAATIERVTGAPVGFAGPVGLAGKLPLYADASAAAASNFVTGANQADAHLVGVNWGRDLPRPGQACDLRVVQAGDPCPKCGQPLELATGIELGHVFKLGTKYTEAMGATYLDEKGESRPILMGCYGIGVNRILAAAIELHRDADGISWPVSLAPYEVLVLPASPKPEAAQTAESIYQELQAAGVEVLLDDRADLRPGAKFKDADLIGFPLRIVIGDRGLKEGVVELVRRSDQHVEKLAPEKAAGAAQAELRRMRAELEAEAPGSAT